MVLHECGRCRHFVGERGDWLIGCKLDLVDAFFDGGLLAVAHVELNALVAAKSENAPHHNEDELEDDHEGRAPRLDYFFDVFEGVQALVGAFELTFHPVLARAHLSGRRDLVRVVVAGCVGYTESAVVHVKDKVMLAHESSPHHDLVPVLHVGRKTVLRSCMSVQILRWVPSEVE